MHPKICTVWCGLRSGGMIDPYFFKGEDENNVTQRQWWSPSCNDFRLLKNIFKYLCQWHFNNGATCHTAHETMDRNEFGKLLISRFGSVNWPPSYLIRDLRMLIYFLWWHVKSLISTDKLASIQALEDNVTRVIDENQQICSKK